MPKTLTKDEHKKELQAIYAKYDREFRDLEKEVQAIRKKAERVLDKMKAKHIRKGISSLT